MALPNRRWPSVLTRLPQPSRNVTRSVQDAPDINLRFPFDIENQMVNKRCVFSDKTIVFEDAETIGSDRFQEAQVLGRVEVRVVFVTAMDTHEPLSLSTSPVPFKARTAALRRLPRAFVPDHDPVFFAVLQKA